jgi:hypothetical protein
MRTQKQIEADAELEQAIQNALEAYGFLDDGSEIISDFVVCLASNKLNEDGTLITSYPVLFRGGDIPWYRIFGLLTTHIEKAKNIFNQGADNG